MSIWGKRVDSFVSGSRPVADGWRDDPERPGIQRYWTSGDGGDWDDTIAPRAKPEPAWKSARVVALGILIAVATVWFIYNMSQPTDAECAIQRLEYATGERAAYDVDDACR